MSMDQSQPLSFRCTASFIKLASNIFSPPTTFLPYPAPSPPHPRVHLRGLLPDASTGRHSQIFSERAGKRERGRKAAGELSCAGRAALVPLSTAWSSGGGRLTARADASQSSITGPHGFGHITRLKGESGPSSHQQPNMSGSGTGLQGSCRSTFQNLDCVTSAAGQELNQDFFKSFC